MIVTDDQRWDTLAYMPTVKAELVGKGMTFSNAFVVNPLCCPSRASILTGTWSHTNGVWNHTPPHGAFPAFHDDSTLPVWLDQSGYETALIGKYLNGYGQPWAEASYIPPGWDRWFAFWNGQGYYDYEVSDDGAGQAFGSDAASYSTDVLAAEAVAFIRETSTPFFLYFAPQAPHISGSGPSASLFQVDPAPRHAGRLASLGPWAPPSLNELGVGDKPIWVRALGPLPTSDLAALRQGQLEALLAVDEAVAAMLAALEETGKLTDTLIVFTSDNGYGWGEHRWVTKLAAYEESIRVPLVLRYDAGTVAAGGIDPRFALNVDLAPTILQVAGVPSRGEGRSLLSSRARSAFLIEHASGSEAKVPAYAIPTYCAIRGQRWKYVQYATGEEELYDLARDPYELGNRARAPVLRRRLVDYRWNVLKSRCRPPEFTPLSRCTRNGDERRNGIRGTRWFDYICARDGNDWIGARDGRRDIVRCGPGFDQVRADGRDRLFGCERVSRS